MSEPARRAGRRFRRKLRSNDDEPEERYSGPALEWPELRRRILEQGGIGPSRDWDREDIPGDLYREHGKPPDLIAAETNLGRSDATPWHSTNDDDMMRYLRRAKVEWDDAPSSAKYSIALSAGALARRRALAEQRTHAARQQFGAVTSRQAKAHQEHAAGVEAYRRAARARRAEQYGGEPAVGFYTDDEGEVHPITAPHRAGNVYAAVRRGRPSAVR